MTFETVPCETCGHPTPMLGTKRCDGCWEVEHRLKDYIKTPRGRAFVKRLLNQRVMRTIAKEKP